MHSQRVGRLRIRNLLSKPLPGAYQNIFVDGDERLGVGEEGQRVSSESHIRIAVTPVGETSVRVLIPEQTLIAGT